MDCWSVLALMKTASLSQVKLLGDFFYKHLNSVTSVGVSLEVSLVRTLIDDFARINKL